MSSKKGKKSKGVTMSLQDFAMKVEENVGGVTPGSGQNIIYADKKPKMPVMSNWADEVEEDGSFFEKERLILPSAPRASRGPAYDDSEIPRNPPYTAHLGNLPYDISDEEIYKFFRDLNIDELKLPRDQQTQRLRGFGYVDFETRQDLIDALIMNESMLRGRPIRITLGTGQQDRRGGDMDRGMRGDGDRRRRPPAEDDDVDDWRSVMKPQGFEPESEFRRGPPSGPGDYGSMPRSGGGYNRDRGDRDRGYGPPRGGPRGPPSDDLDFSRSAMMQGPPPGPPPQHYNTYGGRGSGGPRGGYGQQRDRDYYEPRGGGDRYGGDHQQGYYRGGPPSGPPSHNYPPSNHSRHHSESSDAETGGTWRRQPREHTISQSSQNSQYGPPSSSYHPPHHHQRSESPPLRRPMSPGSDYGRPTSRGPPRDMDDDDMEPPRQSHPEPPKERKRLVLQPRTVDKPPGEAEVGPASIFGGAKPVDTQKREREIEEKLQKLKVETEEPAAEESTESSEQARASGGEGGPPSGPRGQGRSGDRERGERGGGPDGRSKQYSGNAGKEAYIDLEPPFESLKGPPSLVSPGAAPSASRGRLPMQQPPPLRGEAYGNQRFASLRGDDKERGLGDRDRGDRGPYRGSRGGGGGPSRRGGDMDRGPRGGGGEFRRGPGGPRDHDGPPSGRGGGRSYDRDHHGPPGRGGRGGYGGRDDFSRGERDDFRRGPPSHHNSNHMGSSIGSQSEERDRDSHSEPEDDRDMIRGGGGGGAGGPPGEKGEFSDSDGDFTRVERRGRKSYGNRMTTTNNPNPNNNRPPQPRERTFY